MANKKHTSSQATDDAVSTNNTSPPPSKTSRLDINKAKVPPSYRDNMIGPAVQLTVDVKKPGKSTWFQVHTDEGFQADDIVMIKTRDGMEDDYFLILPDPDAVSLTEDMLAVNEAQSFRLFYAITRSMKVFIWPIMLPGADGRTNSWHESALLAVPLLQGGWGRLRPAEGAYDFIPAVSKAEPRWPDWDWQTVLEKAFLEPNIIRNVEHPVVQQILGLAI